MLRRVLEKENYEVRTAQDGAGIVEKVKSYRPHVVLLDVRLPGKNGLDILKELKDTGIEAEIVMITADDTVETAVKAMKMGAWDYLTKPFNLDEVKIVVANALNNVRLKRELEYLRRVNSSLFECGFVGASSVSRLLKEKVETLADARVSSILITGESGVGKEVLARHIHQLMHNSPTAPFVAINLSAVPDTLLESELFGYEKGAFTDARGSKQGLFEIAEGGTLLLDEIGEMKLNLQAKLLRVLEDRKVRRIGGKDEIDVDATIIATTNRDLKEAVKRGEFRMDLYYRLNTFSLYIPPLRERVEDIPVLARHFLKIFSQEYGKKIEGFSPEAEKFLLTYPWPGNVRELKNIIQGIVVLHNAKTVSPEHLPAEITEWKKRIDASPHPFSLPEEGLSLEELEKNLIIQALQKTSHNKAKAAKLLGLTYDSLRYQMKKFGLD